MTALCLLGNCRQVMSGRNDCFILIPMSVSVCVVWRWRFLPHINCSPLNPKGECLWGKIYWWHGINSPRHEVGEFVSVFILYNPKDKCLKKKPSLPKNLDSPTTLLSLSLSRLNRRERIEKDSRVKDKEMVDMECVTTWDKQFVKEDCKPFKTLTIDGEYEDFRAMAGQCEAMWLDRKDIAGTDKFADIVFVTVDDEDIEFTELLASETFREVLPDMGSDWNLNHKSGLSSRTPYVKHTVLDNHTEWFNDLFRNLSEIAKDIRRVDSGHRKERCPVCDEKHCKKIQTAFKVVEYDDLTEEIKQRLKMNDYNVRTRSPERSQKMTLEHLAKCPVCKVSVNKSQITGRYKPRCKSCWRAFFRERERCGCGAMKKRGYRYCYNCYRERL